VTPETKAAESELTLAIEGMTCASCVRTVEGALEKVTGVSDASVNLANETARVRFAQGSVAVPELVKAVKAAGYGAREREAGSEERERVARLAELARTRRRLIVSLVLASAAMVVSMAPHVISGIEHADWRAYLLFALATPVQFYAGWPFYRTALAAARHRQTNMSTLVVVGTTAAYGVSVAATFVPSVFFAARLEPHQFLYYETSAVIIALVLLGRYLEARDAYERLEKLKPGDLQVLIALARIWSEVLEIDPVGVTDSFFDLGGDFLRAAQIVSRVIKQFQLQIPLELLFQSPTIAAMAAVITENQLNQPGAKQLESILDGLESMSDEEAQRRLNEVTSTIAKK